MKKILVVLSILALTFSCAIERGEDERTEKLERPDMVLENGTFRISSGSGRPVELTSSVLTYWSKDGRAEMEGLSFSQTGEDGTERIRGIAMGGTMDTKKKILTLIADVYLEDLENGLRISTGGTLVFYIDSEEVFADDSVMVEYSDGRFEGSGFYGDLKREEYSFEKIEEGRFDV